MDHLPQALKQSARPTIEPANIVISGTMMWNPGDDFVRDGVIAVLRSIVDPRPLNLFFYNFSANVQPPHGRTGSIGNDVAAGDLESLGIAVDAVVIAGLSAGDEIKDLYRWIINAGLTDRVLLIGAGYENNYVDEHCRAEPEATVFRDARIITGRTEKIPDFIESLGTPYAHIPCPALLSIPACKRVPRGQRARALGFSIQLPHADGIVNQATGDEAARLAMRTMLGLADRGYDITLIAHHKSEFIEFAHRFRGGPVKVVFQSFATDLPEVYRKLDAIITTRLHAGLYANAHGLPALIINDTDRHTHALDGFRHAQWATSEAEIDSRLENLLTADLGLIAEELAADKEELLARYDTALRDSVESLIKPLSPLETLGQMLRAALGAPEVKRRVLQVIEQLTPDHWLEINIRAFQNSAALGELWFDTVTALNWLAGALRPKTYLEVGVRRGRSLTQVLTHSRETLAFGFDLWIPDYGSIPEQGIIVENPGPGFVAEELARLDLPPASALIEGNSRSTLPAFFADPENPQQIELLHIDGDHSDEGAKADLQIAFERVAPGGAIVFDDLHHPSHPGLKAVWDAFKPDRPDWLFVEDADRAGTAVAIRPPFDCLAAALAVNTSLRPEEVLSVSPESQPAPASSTAPSDEPVHYFTIVLNGMPFIEHHLDAFEAAGGNWHWHIVEGVGDLNHDTAWSVRHGGRIPASLHHNGRSIDGTSEYIDRIASKYPDRITVYRKPLGEFWDGKVEMVNAPLATIKEACLLWQIDVDELWTPDQLSAARRLFAENTSARAAYYYCHYFVGPDRVITSRDTYGNHTEMEWLRTWRYRPGCRWAAHEPPRLIDPAAASHGTGGDGDVAKIKPLSQSTTEAAGLVFQHFAYATEAQLRFKEHYYGYTDAVEQWHRLQNAAEFPLRLSDYFEWVRDDAVVETAASAGVRPLLAPEKFVATTPART